VTLPDKAEPRSGRTDLLLAFAGVDELWAGWIRDRLERGGRTVTLARPGDGTAEPPFDQLRGYLQRADTVLVLLSDSFFGARQYTVADWSSALAALGPGAERVVAVLTRPVEVHGLPAGVALADLADVAEETAYARLRHALARAGVAGPESPAGPRMPQRAILRGAARFPGHPPEIVGGLRHRHPHFTGRDGLLDAIRRELTGGGALPLVLEGPEGSGRTQLAVEYAHRFGAAYDIVWFVDAAGGLDGSLTAVAVRDSLARLGQRTGVPCDRDLGRTARAVRADLSDGAGGRRWLLVCDGAQDVAEVAPLLPVEGGHVLITARTNSWAGRATVLAVGDYTAAESLTFLRRRTPHLPGPDARRLVELVGHLPLSLAAAADHVTAAGVTVDDCARLIAADLPRLPGAPFPSRPDRPMTRACLPSFDRLRQEVPAAHQLLELCAFLGEAAVPLALLTSAPCRGVALPWQLAGALRDPDQLADVLSVVSGTMLAEAGVDPESGGTTLAMHPAVARVIQMLVATRARAEFRDAQCRAQSLLAAADPGDPGDPANFATYQILLRHLGGSGTLLRHDSPDARRQVTHAVEYLMVRREWAACRDLARRALASWSPHLSRTDPSVILLRLRIARALRHLGHVEGALRHSEVALAAATLAGGVDRSRCDAAGEYAASLRLLGRFREALELDRQTHAEAVEILGPADWTTLRTAHRLAVSLRLNGLFDEALRLDRQTYAARRRQRPCDLATLLSVDSIARDERETGLVRESLERQSRTRERYLGLMPPTSPGPLRAAGNLAVSLRRAGYLQQARELAERVLADHLDTFGPDSWETVAARTNLANDLRLTGDLADAEREAGAALAHATRALGENHPHSLACAVNLAVMERLRGQLAGATARDNRTLRRLTDVLGEQHPHMLACLTNLASDHADADDLTLAVSLGRRAYAGHVAARGRTHPHTLACGANLAADLAAAGDPEARDLLADVATGYLRTLGPGHPEYRAAVTDHTRLDLGVEPSPL
jgi:hypothetical protein